MELEGSSNRFNVRQFSMLCFSIAERFHWTLDYIREMALPDFYSLMEYLEKTQQK